MIINIISPKHGKFEVQIDDEDHDKISEYNWGIGYCKHTHSFYAKSAITPHFKSGQKTIRMHRLITDAQKGEVVDHIDHDTLNNKKSNLRKCASGQNTMNYSKPSDGVTSKYKGVWKNNSGRKFVSGIRVKTRLIHLGTFANEVDAARAYNKAALEYHGEYALLNIIEEV